jgi:hypothetical protein
MGRFAKWAIALPILATASFLALKATAADENDPINALTKDQPPEVAAFIVRFVGCQHWAGEEPYDKERAKEIETALKELNCERIKEEEKILRSRYARSPRVLKALDDAPNAVE